MPYDDDGSRFHFQDFIDLEDFLRDYLSFPGNLTFGQVKAVLQTFASLSAKVGANKITIQEVEKALNKHGLSHMPVSVAAGLIDAIAPIAHHDDALSRISVQQIEEIISKVRRGKSGR